jgi:hypothetical protein
MAYPVAVAEEIADGLLLAFFAKCVVFSHIKSKNTFLFLIKSKKHDIYLRNKYEKGSTET